MKCTCTQQDLARGVSLVNHAVSSRSTLPILANILLASDQGRLKLTATNLEIGISCWIDADIQEEGAITVPAKVFSDHINSLSQMGEIELIVPQDTQTMAVKSQRGRSSSNSNIVGMDPEEFPELPTPEKSIPTMELDAALLKEVIGQVAFAAADDESRPVFTAVRVQLKKQKAIFAAADAFRLAIREVDLLDLEGSGEDILIPARTFSELSRILPSGGPVQMTVSPNRSQVLFHTESLDLISRLVEATFPNVEAVVPKEYTTRAVLDRKELAGAIKSAVPFARDSSNIINVRMSAPRSGETLDSMTIQAVAEDVGDNVSTLDAQVEGAGLEKIIFNCRYLSEALSALDCPQVALEVTTGARPGVVKPVGALAGQYTYIVMPMSTNR